MRKLALPGAIGTLATTLAFASLIAPAQAGRAVPLAQGGTLIGWGKAASAAAQTLPADLQGTAFIDVATGNGFTVALTAEGKVKVLGASGNPNAFIEEVPASLDSTTVAEITTSANHAGAITTAGRVVVWGPKDDNAADPYDVPGDLANVVDLAIAQNSAAAVKTDGTVVTWGNPGTFNELVVPPEAVNVTAIAANGSTYYALKNNGSQPNNRTVVAWGNGSSGATTLPQLLTDTTDALEVTAISARSNGGLALMSDGSLVNWGQSSTPGNANAIPTSLSGKTIRAISALGVANAAVATDGTIALWGSSVASSADMTTIPSSLTGADVTAISAHSNHVVVLVTKVLPVAKPTIAGTPTVGQTLTATPAAFSGAPTSVTGQWLAGGVAITDATATTLTLTSALVGKAITYASSAVKGSAAPVIETSAPTAAVQPGIAPSATSINAPAKAYGSTGTATVVVSNTAGRPVTGSVTLSGAGATQTKSVSGGKATFSLPKTLTPRTYTLTAKYNGNAQLTVSSRTAKYTVAKGKTKTPGFKANTMPTSKKPGKATVTVTAPSGLAKASGKVTVTLKGKTKKTIKATLSGGKKTITLPKLKKGTYKVTVSYAGDSRYVSAKSKTYSLKIKK